MNAKLNFSNAKLNFSSAKLNFRNAKLNFSRMALPTPLRGGVAEGRGGVNIFFVDRMLQTPLTPPLKGVGRGYRQLVIRCWQTF